MTARKVAIVVAALVLGLAGSLGIAALSRALLERPGSILLSGVLGIAWGLALSWGLLATWPSRWDR